jgi:hypothetical protein
VKSVSFCRTPPDVDIRIFLNPRRLRHSDRERFLAMDPGEASMAELS